MANFVFGNSASRGLLVVVFCLGAATLARAEDAGRHLDPAFPNYQPPYPDAAQVNGEQGDVGLKVRVNQNGLVRNIEIEKTSGFDDLDNAAIEGVLRWHYLPSERWSSWEHVTIAYRLPTAIIVPPGGTVPPAAPSH
jgi:TonB family protein